MRYSDIITENEYKDNPIPMSSEFNQDRGNLSWFVTEIEKETADSSHIRKINVRSLVDSHKLFSTQDWLCSYGGGDPVFDELEEPVICEYNEIGYIIDGHHRLAEAYEKNIPFTYVHWVKIESNVNEEIITEGPNDPHIFKAIFLLGGPGSGKTYIGKQLIQSTGLRYINLDVFFEHMAKKRNLNPTDVLISNPEELKHAGVLSAKKQNLHIEERLGLLIDGTGRRTGRITETNNFLKSLGYDTIAIYVNVDIDIALERNSKRERVVNTEFVKKAHNDIRANLGYYQNLFSSLLIIDNNTDNPDLSNAWKKVQKFINSPLSYKAKQWLENQKDAA